MAGFTLLQCFKILVLKFLFGRHILTAMQDYFTAAKGKAGGDMWGRGMGRGGSVSRLEHVLLSWLETNFLTSPSSFSAKPQQKGEMGEQSPINHIIRRRHTRASWSLVVLMVLMV